VNKDGTTATWNMARSLEYYYDLIFWINYLIYMIYFVLKYFMAPVLWILLEKANKAKKGSKLAKLARITIPMRALILTLFGGPLGIVQRHGDTYKRDTQDDNDVPTLYIRNEKLSYGVVMVLSMIIATFGILTLTSAVNLSLLKITRVCSEDSYIDCYPQLIYGANETIVGLFNITINTDEPILDCTFWDSEGVSSQVTFVCFQFVYDFTAFLASMGGLLTIFTITMKISTAILLWLNGICNCGMGSSCLEVKHAVRAILAVATAFIEIGLALVCLIIGTAGHLADDEGNPPIIKFIAMHASKVLIVFGVVATLLWLPWEIYTQQNDRTKDTFDAVELEEAASSNKYVLM
jgi:hypothetical protein